MLIGISGKIGSGKDTIGKIIRYLAAPGAKAEDHDWSEESLKDLDNEEAWNPMYFNTPEAFQIKRWAGKLKETCSLLTGIPVKDFEKQEVKDQRLPEIWDIVEESTTGKLLRMYDGEGEGLDYAREMGWQPESFFSGMGIPEGEVGVIETTKWFRKNQL